VVRQDVVPRAAPGEATSLMVQGRNVNRLNSSWAVLALVTVAGLGALARGPAPAARGTRDGSEVKVMAKKYEFNPNVITVRQGDHVRLVITAVDRHHGIKLETLNIDRKLQKDEPTTIEFIADKAGTFPFQCSNFCGLGHGKMKGKLVVEQASNP
jgi:cytochrome c oxidase subunit II